MALSDAFAVLGQCLNNTMFVDRCDVYEFHNVPEDNGSTGSAEVLTQSDVPCRVSYKSAFPASPGEVESALAQVITLFVSADVNINAGSKVIVTRDSATTAYQAAGVPKRYPSHLEYALMLAESENVA